MASSAQIRQDITRKLIDALERNTTPFWRRPWTVSKNAGRPANVISRRPYSGVNPLLLRLHQLEHRYRSRWYGTFDQIKSLGGHVKKRPASLPPGEPWGCHIVFYRPLAKTVIDRDTNEEREERFALLRTFVVFNVDQCDGESLDKFRVRDDDDNSSGIIMPDYEPAEQLIEACGAKIEYGGERAFYVRPTPEEAWPHHKSGDVIHMPERKRFVNVGAFYETLLHELAHFSEVRIGFPRKEQGYAFGEMYAEIASSYLCAELGVPQGEDLANHAAYLRSWLTAMKADPSFIFRASTWASKATDYLLSFVQTEPSAVAEQAA